MYPAPKQKKLPFILHFSHIAICHWEKQKHGDRRQATVKMPRPVFPFSCLQWQLFHFSCWCFSLHSLNQVKKAYSTPFVAVAVTAACPVSVVSQAVEVVLVVSVVSYPPLPTPTLTHSSHFCFLLVLFLWQRRRQRTKFSNNIFHSKQNERPNEHNVALCHCTEYTTRL